jgi:hypothetical protein
MWAVPTNEKPQSKYIMSHHRFKLLASFFITSSRMASEPIQTPIQWLPGVNHLLPSGVRLRMHGAIPAFSHVIKVW